MKCPWCNSDLIDGYVQASDNDYVFFTNKRRVFFKFPNLSTDNEVMLTTNSLKYGHNCAAYRCVNCKKVVIDYSSTPQQIG